jgi:hypothetical protein
MDDEHVVGFLASLSDGVLYAHLTLLEVLPEYPGRGIGTELVRRMINAFSNLYAIDVLCDPELQPFYERLGLSPASRQSRRESVFQHGFDNTGTDTVDELKLLHILVPFFSTVCHKHGMRCAVRGANTIDGPTHLVNFG